MSESRREPSGSESDARMPPSAHLRRNSSGVINPMAVRAVQGDELDSGQETGVESPQPARLPVSLSLCLLSSVSEPSLAFPPQGFG